MIQRIIAYKASALIVAVIASTVFVILLMVLFSFSGLLQNQVRRSIAGTQALTAGNGALNHALLRYRDNDSFTVERYSLATGSFDVYLTDYTPDPTKKVITARVYTPNREDANKICKLDQALVAINDKQFVKGSYREINELTCGAAASSPSP